MFFSLPLGGFPPIAAGRRPEKTYPVKKANTLYNIPEKKSKYINTKKFTFSIKRVTMF